MSMLRRGSPCMSNMLVTHAALRLWTYGEGKWVAYNLIHKQRCIISSNIAATLVAFINGSSVKEAFTLLDTYLKLPEQEFIELCSKLEKYRLLVKEKEDSHVFSSHIVTKWKKYNWIEAADYYLATFDYPFIVEGEDNTYAQKDSDRMLKYFTDEPDFNRSKEYNNSLIDISTITANEALQTLTTPFSSLFLPPNDQVQVTSNNIKVICAAAFGKLRERISTNPCKANAVRKTSPSGGSRHPTEGYVMLQEALGDLPSGIYHFSLSKNALEKIDNLPSKEEIEEMLPGVFRASFIPKAIFILTSLFERNMYRYREPRTFRTIFIDIGHVASTIKLISKGLGIKYFAHSYIIEEKVEKLLQLNKFNEGAVYAVAVA